MSKKDKIIGVYNNQVFEATIREALKDGLKEVKQKLEKQKLDLEWYNLFVDYIQNVHPNLYNEACEYADNKTMEV
tara:strand:- start:1004 stop:1228 length:225 start_codon:yes stop_codon:yes gene_type:complete